MNQSTNQIIIDLYINKDISKAREVFKRLDSIERIHFFNYVFNLNNSFSTSIDIYKRLGGE